MIQQDNLHLMWFRQDLRLLDNTALSACCEQAAAQHAPVMAIYYLTPQQWQQHDKSLWQIDLLLRQLMWLKTALAERHIGLVIRTVADFTAQGDDLLNFCQTQGIYQVFANQEYLVNETQRDASFVATAHQHHINAHWFDDYYLIPPKSIVNLSGNPYKVFTPFYKRWSALLETKGVTVLDIPSPHSTDSVAFADGLNQTAQIPTITAFYQLFYKHNLANSTDADVMSSLVETPQLLERIAQTGEQRYPSGEDTALARLADFLAEDSGQYAVARDVPAYHGTEGATSRLSPYLALGIISPRICYQHAIDSLGAYGSGESYVANTLQWVRQLAWRDFYGDIVVNYPNIVKGEAFLHPLDTAVPWRYARADFTAWCQGMTGVPFVDAAMRCLNATGLMHNRLRMIVAMYLTKNLLIDWRWGERYFMLRLVDGEFANNNGGWQWSASIGTDAQPYFRVMNPFSQALNYDSDAIFIKQWLPCLAIIPPTILHNESKLQSYLKANPAIDYPKLAAPTKITRAEAIAIFKKIRTA